MRKIDYTFITLARQFLFITIGLLATLYLIVIIQIMVFHIDKYYDRFNYPLTFGIYLLVYLCLGCLFFQHRFFHLTYTRSTLTYRNGLLRRERSVSLEDISNVVCDSRGAWLYRGPVTDKKQACFYIHFFRGGVIEVVAFDKFLRYLSSQGAHITKTYKVMPGYGKIHNILGIVYGFLAICIILNCRTPLYTVIVLMSNH